MFRRLLAQAFQKPRRGRKQPLERLHDHCGDLVGMLGDELAREVGVVEGRDQHGVAHTLGDARRVGHGLRKIHHPLRREAHLRL